MVFSAFCKISFAATDINNDLKKPLVITSINPIYQIALAITQDKNNTILIINPTFSEHNYQLKKSDAEFISKADLIFYISTELENNFTKFIKNYDKKSQAYELIKINDIKLLRNRGNPKKDDIHIWLNPDNAIKIAEFISKKIIEIDPQNAKKYQKNLANLKKEILVTQENVKENLVKISGKNYIFYHDGYQYFEDYFVVKPIKVIFQNHHYGFRSNDLKEIDSLIKTKKVKCIFSEPQDENNSAMKLAQNYKVKFSILDGIGLKENYNKANGYSALLFNLSNQMTLCLDAVL